MTYSDITVGQFLDIHAIQKQYDGTLKDIIRNQKIYSVITGVSQEEIDIMTVEEWKEKSKIMSFLGEDTKTKELSDMVFVGDKEYKRILDARKISFGKFIDVTTVTRDEEDGDENRIDRLDEVMALLIEHDEDHDVFSKKVRDGLKMDDVFPHMVFFSKVFKELLNHLPSYLSKEIQTMMKTLQDKGIVSQDTGDGQSV